MATTTDALFASAHEALAFTAEALRVNAGDDADLRRLATHHDAALADWDAIDADGRAIQRALARARARVSVADATLDHAIARFARDLQAAGDTDLYAKLFPEPHEDVIDLGLDAELPVAMLIMTALDDGEQIPASLREHAGAIRAAVQLGNSALADRSEAFAARGRHGARVEAWLEGAVSTTRNTRRALARLAEVRKHPPRWVDAFFPRALG